MLKFNVNPTILASDILRRIPAASSAITNRLA